VIAFFFIAIVVPPSVNRGLSTDTRSDRARSIEYSGGIRYYQIWYRDAAAFCTSNTFNLTNGLEVIWSW